MSQTNSSTSVSLRTAIITGGASGIGLALAVQLQARAVHVIAVDRDEDALASLPSSIEGRALDVTDRDAFRALVGEVVEEHGRVDYLFNNAGVGIAGELRDMQPRDWRRVVEVNLFGVIHGVDAAYPVMIEQGFGCLVNVASLAGLIELPGESVYVASKHAVVGLTRTLRAEARHYGVDVCLVCPGVVNTPIYDTSPVVGFDKDASLALWPEGISAERCAELILQGLDRGRGTVVVTPMAQVLWRLHRLSPSIFSRAAGLYMARLRTTRVADSTR
ncbi:MAG: SDR family NAD(P)-dependent oxidoreductase [Sandaracinaceae bacterium]